MELLKKTQQKLGTLSFHDGKQVQRCLPTVRAPTVEKHSLDQPLLQGQGWTNLPPMGSKLVETEVGFFFWLIMLQKKYIPPIP